MEFVNYKVTITQPDGSEHVDLYPSRESAEEMKQSLKPWPVTVEPQRFQVEIGTVLTVRSPGNGREFTGVVDAMRNGKAVHISTGYPDNSWFFPLQVLRVEDPAETREHSWLPPLDGIRICKRVRCYAQWMPRNAEPLGCKGTGSE